MSVATSGSSLYARIPVRAALSARSRKAALTSSTLVSGIPRGPLRRTPDDPYRAADRLAGLMLHTCEPL
jgi:hypothetical protein